MNSIMKNLVLSVLWYFAMGYGMSLLIVVGAVFEKTGTVTAEVLMDSLPYAVWVVIIRLATYALWGLVALLISIHENMDKRAHKKGES